MKRNSIIVSAFVIVALLLGACSTSTALSGLIKPNANQVQVGQVTTPTAAPSSAAPTSPAVGSTPSTPVTGLAPAPAVLAALQGTLEQIYTQMGPSVVNIQVTSGATSQQNPNNPFGFGNPQGNQSGQVSQALGSGFVYDNQGDIITNNHVVDGADNIQVTFSDGFTVPAKVVGTDVNSDLAVVKVDVPSSRLHPVVMGDSTTVKVGQLALAIGNPFGLSGSMTMGIISAVGRSLPVNSNTANGGSYTIPNVIQTDAPINPGNSGGPLMNDQGQVIGVNSQIESSTGSNSGIGFAIPSVIIQKVVPVLISKGSYQYSYIGISGATLTFDINQANGLKTDQRGALVVEVTSGGPAEKAGIKGSSNQKVVNGAPVPVGGDVITAIDGQPVNVFEDLVGYLILNTQPGQTVKLTVLRGGQQQDVSVTLAARPSSPSPLATNNNTNPNGNTNPFSTPGGNATPFFNPGGNATPFGNSPTAPTAPATTGVYLGIASLDLTPAINQAMNLNNNQQGVLVEQVQTGSPAEKAGLKGSTTPVNINGQQVLVGGDVIVAINGQALTSTSDLRNALTQFNPGQQVTLTVIRNGQQGQVNVTLAARPAQ